VSTFKTKIEQKQNKNRTKTKQKQNKNKTKTEQKQNKNRTKSQQKSKTKRKIKKGQIINTSLFVLSKKIVEHSRPLLTLFSICRF